MSTFLNKEIKEDLTGNEHLRQNLNEMQKADKKTALEKTSPGRGENVDVLGGKPLGVAALRQESWNEEAGTSSWGLDPPLSLRLLYAARYKSHCGVLSGGGPSADLHCSEVSLALW